MTLSDLRLLFADAGSAVETAVAVNRTDLDALLTIAEEVAFQDEHRSEPHADGSGDFCTICCKTWPCPTRKALDVLEGK